MVLCEDGGVEAGKADVADDVLLGERGADLGVEADAVVADVNGTVVFASETIVKLVLADVAGLFMEEDEFGVVVVSSVECGEFWRGYGLISDEGRDVFGELAEKGFAFLAAAVNEDVVDVWICEVEEVGRSVGVFEFE